MHTIAVFILALFCVASADAHARPSSAVQQSYSKKKKSERKVQKQSAEKTAPKRKPKKASFWSDVNEVFAPKATLKSIGDDLKNKNLPPPGGPPPPGASDTPEEMPDDSGVNLNRRKGGFKIGAHGKF